jgi:hypothetical protein
MSERRDPSGQGSQPSPIEQSGEKFVSHAEQTTGRGVLTSGSNRVGEVTYTATLMEQKNPSGQAFGPVFTGHGILSPGEELDFDPDRPELVLHLRDGRSVPIEIDAPVEGRGYRFQVRSPR